MQGVKQQRQFTDANKVRRIDVAHLHNQFLPLKACHVKGIMSNAGSWLLA